MADLRIDVAAEFKGRKAFTEATNATSRLDKAVGKLGKQFLGVFAAQKLIAYSKQSVKAFAEDEAAARRLATAVDNLGLSFSQSRVETFIAQTEASAGILDDQLRPAMQALLTTTGSLTKSQELLNNAIQISRASGIDLATVSQDLANGFVGITRGLKKYNTGLTQSELKTKSFADILGIMLAKSAGSAQAYLETTSYKLDVLNVAANNAKETIGKGLVDAFARIGGGSDAKDAAVAIDNIAKAVSRVIVVTGTAIGAIEKFRKAYTNFLAGGDVNELMAKPQVSTNRSASPAGVAARTKQQREAEAAAAKRAKELAALTKKQITAQKALTAEQKKQAALKKAGTVFDLEQIQLVAALKGKLSKEEELRVQAQLALLNDNAALATKLTNQILAAQDASGNLAKFLSALPNAKNPFEYLDAYLSYLAGKAAAILTNQPVPTQSSTGNTTVPTIPSTNVPTMPSDNMITYNQLTGLNYNPNANNVVVELKITGGDDVSKAIANNLQQQSLSTGNVTYINRRTGGFE